MRVRVRGCARVTRRISAVWADEDPPPDEAPDLARIDWSNPNTVARAEAEYGRRAVRVAWAEAFLADPRDVWNPGYVEVPSRDDPRRGRDGYGARLSDEDYLIARATAILRNDVMRRVNAENKKSAKAARSAANRQAWRVRKEAEEVARVAAKHGLDSTTLTPDDARRITLAGHPDPDDYVSDHDDLAAEFTSHLDDPDS